jgi:glycopeptide antibiotics resistance protein
MMDSSVRTRRHVWLPAAGVYLLAVAYLTLAPRFGTSGALTPNFVPFASVIDLLFDSAATPAGMLKNLAGNLVLLAPLAAFIYLGLRWTVARTLGAVAAVSLFIEVVQGLGLTDGRQANVDDLLLNLAGAAMTLLALLRARRADCA